MTMIDVVACFFPTGKFSREECEVLVQGLPRRDYRLFREEKTGKPMIYFDSMTADEEASVVVRRVQS